MKTTPMRATFDDIARVWREADALPDIDHAWLWDHFLPLFAPPTDPVLEGWTLLAALAAQTERLGMGLLVTSNAVRPPAVLAKMAATVDVISHGRLVLGLGAGGTRQPAAVDNPPPDPTLPPCAAATASPQPSSTAVAEYAAYGLPLVSPGEGIGRLAESLTLIRRMWTEEKPFDFDGRYYRTQGTACEPKPVQPSGPPILIGGSGDRLLRVVAEHADIWNIAGPPHGTVEQIAERSAVLDAHCAARGRDPAAITRSTQMIVAYDDPAASRAAILDLVGVGVTHIVLALQPPYPEHAARWLVDEVIAPVKAST